MTSTTSRTTARTSARVAAALGAAALAVALAACGSSSDGRSAGSMGGMGGMDGMGHGASPSASPSASSSSSSAAGQHDSADVTFAQQMVVHHQGAIAMADLAADRAGDQRVKDLAARIRAAQAPEIDQMTGWLQAWGEPTPAATASGTGGMGGMHHGDGGSAMGVDMGSDMGMMTDEQRGQLSAASGAAFDRLFLQMMVVHHQGAVAMSQQEQASGSSSEAKALAASIVTSQTAEIAEMQQLLADLG